MKLIAKRDARGEEISVWEEKLADIKSKTITKYQTGSAAAAWDCKTLKTIEDY